MPGRQISPTCNYFWNSCSLSDENTINALLFCILCYLRLRVIYLTYLGGSVMPMPNPKERHPKKERGRVLPCRFGWEGSADVAQ